MDATPKQFDHSSDPKYFERYSRASESEETVTRFSRVMDSALGLLRDQGRRAEQLDVADIDGGAGTQALLWAEVLPLCSWYPGLIKRWCEKKEVTTHPRWANHARYPAVRWFTYYEVSDWFQRRGFRTFDRYDVLSRRPRTPAKRLSASTARTLPFVRFLGHVVTEGTAVWAVRG